MRREQTSLSSLNQWERNFKRSKRWRLIRQLKSLAKWSKNLRRNSRRSERRIRRCLTRSLWIKMRRSRSWMLSSVISKLNWRSIEQSTLRMEMLFRVQRCLYRGESRTYWRPDRKSRRLRLRLLFRTSTSLSKNRRLRNWVMNLRDARMNLELCQVVIWRRLRLCNVVRSSSLGVRTKDLKMS